MFPWRVRLVCHCTLDCAISVGHSNSMKPTLMINPCQISTLKIMWVTILTHATFVLDLVVKVLVRSEVPRKTYGKTRGLGPTLFPPLTRQLQWPALFVSTIIFLPH
jgi:hypothetical protein